MRHYQNTLTGEVVSEDEYSYAAAQKGNWVLYPKIPRYTIETPPYAAGRTEFAEDYSWTDAEGRANRFLPDAKGARLCRIAPPYWCSHDMTTVCEIGQEWRQP